MFSEEQVRDIARLARLQLTDAEVEKYRKQLGRVLEYVRDLESVAVTEPGVVRHVPRDAVAFRGDKVLPFSSVRALLDNAPVLENDGFGLPTAVVEHE